MKTPHSWPFGQIEKCTHLCNNTWTNIQGTQFPEGLPFLAGSIDFEWSCTAKGNASIAPLIGTAQDSQSSALYFWLSDRLINENNPAILCKVGQKVQTLRAHNVPADRTKVFESYEFEDKLHWSCTMSRHTLLAGACSGQQFIMRKTAREESSWKPYFMDFTALKNILDVYNFWVNPEVPLLPESKEIRNIFFKGSMNEIRENFSELMTYSLRDAVLVNEIHEAQAPAFTLQLPAKVRQQASEIRGNVVYSLNPQFSNWVEHCEKTFVAEVNRLNSLARQLVTEKCELFKLELLESFREFRPEEIPSEWRIKSGAIAKKWQCPVKQNLELNPSTLRVVNNWNKKYSSRDWLPTKGGFPKWYAKISELSYGTAIVQDLCELLYFNQPVFYCKIDKFCFLKSDGSKQKVFSPKKGPMTEDNCGSLFSADFVSLFENGSITSDNKLASEITSTATDLSYWTSVRNRLFCINMQQELYQNTRSEPEPEPRSES